MTALVSGKLREYYKSYRNIGMKLKIKNMDSHVAYAPLNDGEIRKDVIASPSESRAKQSRNNIFSIFLKTSEL